MSYSYLGNNAIRTDYICATIDNFIPVDKKYTSKELNVLTDNKVILPLNTHTELIDDVSKDSEELDDVNEKFFDKIHYCFINEDDKYGLVGCRDEYSSYVLNVIDKNLNVNEIRKDALSLLKDILTVLKCYKKFVEDDNYKRSLEEKEHVEFYYNKALTLYNHNIKK